MFSTKKKISISEILQNLVSEEDKSDIESGDESINEDNTDESNDEFSSISMSFTGLPGVINAMSFYCLYKFLPDFVCGTYFLFSEFNSKNNSVIIRKRNISDVQIKFC